MHGPGGAQEIRGATAVVAEMEIGADGNARNAQRLDQEARDEILGLHHAEVAAERHQHDAVEAERGAEAGFRVGRGQAEHERGRREHVARMRLEGQHHGRHVARLGLRLEPRQNGLVAAMHAVEGPDRHHGALEGRRHIVETIETVESGHGRRPQSWPLYRNWRLTTQGAAGSPRGGRRWAPPAPGWPRDRASRRHRPRARGSSR